MHGNGTSKRNIREGRYKEMDNIVHIAYATDDGYAKLAGISILSLLENNKSIPQLEIHIFDDEISVENQEKLRSIAANYDRQISFYNVKDKLAELTQQGVTGYGCSVNIGMTAYSRLFAHDILPDSVTRIIYFDCDTMINGDIEPLFNMDLGNCALGMAVDCVRNEYKKYINYPIDQPYYNSGVMIMDLKRWYEHKCMDRIWEHITKIRSDYPLVDQDFLNVVLPDEICTIDLRYNFLSQEFLYSYKGLLRVYGLRPDFWYDRSTYEAARAEPIVYHFCGKTFIRPWYKNSLHPLKKKYDCFYFLSPWRSDEQKIYQLAFQYKLQLFLYKKLPPAINILAGTIMQRVFIWSNYKC